MLVSAQARYPDYSARLLDRRISRVGDRAEEDRRRNARRRPSADQDRSQDREASVAQVLLPFSAPQAASSDLMMPDLVKPDLIKPDLVIPDLVIPDLMMPDLMQPDLVLPALSTDALWTLIDAVDAGGSVPTPSIAPTQDADPEPATASQAESLYLLLAQVIGDDLDDEPADHGSFGSHI